MVSINREAEKDTSRRTAVCRTAPWSSSLKVLTFRRADGREVSLEEFPLAQALSTGETVRAEEIVIQVPDGRSVTTLVNATPIRSEEGEVESRRRDPTGHDAPGGDGAAAGRVPGDGEP